MHEVLVNRLGGLSLPRKSVVRLTDRPNMTLDVYRGRKTTSQQQLTAEKLLEGHNSSKNQLSMTSIKYAHLQVMGITGKFHQNPLKTVGGVAETRLCLQTDG